MFFCGRAFESTHNGAENKFTRKHCEDVVTMRFLDDKNSETTSAMEISWNQTLDCDFPATRRDKTSETLASSIFFSHSCKNQMVCSVGESVFAANSPYYESNSTKNVFKLNKTRYCHNSTISVRIYTLIFYITVHREKSEPSALKNEIWLRMWRKKSANDALWRTRWCANSKIARLAVNWLWMWFLRLNRRWWTAVNKNPGTNDIDLR